MGLMEKLEAFDQGVWNWFVHHHRPGLDGLLVGVAVLAERWALAGVTLLAAAGLLVRGRRRQAAAVGGAFVAAVLLALATKALVGRERPEVAVAPLERLPDSASFPSERTLAGTAVYGLLGLLLAAATRRTWAGAAVLAGAGLLVFLIGLSRLYVGVCFPTDVLAGWAAGAALALAAARWSGPFSAS